MLQTKKKTQKIHLLAVEELAPNGMQPRKMFSEEGLLALSESIKLHGFLQPITVRRADPSPFPEGITAPTFEIIAGERRWRAAKLAGLEKVPCVIREADKEESAYLALIENIQRKDLGFFEEAEALRNLLLMTDYSQGELAEKLSISPSALSNKLRLLSLPGNQREMILKAGLGERHARAFLKIRDDAARQKAIRKAAEEGLTAKATEALADSVAGAVTAFTEEEKEVEKAPPKKHRVCLIKDLRFFFNTLERSLDLLTEAGFLVEKQQSEGEEAFEISLRIGKQKQEPPR